MKDQNSLAVEIRRFPRHRIAAWSVLIIAMFGSSLYAQTSEKPRAFLFDEFEKLDDREIDSRTLKLRQKVQERAWTKEPYSVYIVVFKDEKNSSTRPVEKRITDVLFKDCRDCMGYGGPRITLVRAGKEKRQKVQFWLIPPGAEPPTIDNSDN